MLRIKWFFEIRDLWIGIYWTPNYPWIDIYICLMPCIPLRISILAKDASKKIDVKIYRA